MNTKIDPNIGPAMWSFY